MKSNVILVSGDALKKEKNFAGATAVPGQLVANIAGGDVNLAGASYPDNIMVIDLSSAKGFGIDDTFGLNDQIPIIYPTNGCVVNVVMDATAGAVAKGAKLYWTGTGVKTVATTEPVLFIAVEAKTYVAADTRIKVEVVK